MGSHKRTSVVRRVKSVLRSAKGYGKATSQGRARRKQLASIVKSARKSEPVKSALKQATKLGVKVNLADYKKPLVGPTW